MTVSSVEDLGRLLVAQIPALRRYARALSGAGADDLVQDCLERAWRRRESLRSEEEIRVWLFAILHNLYVSGIRRQSRQPEPVGLSDNDTSLSNLPAQESSMELEDVDRALTALDPDQRAAVLLVGVEDMSYQEAAVILGIPLGTLMSRLHRGRRRLRALLQGDVAPLPLKRVK